MRDAIIQMIRIRLVDERENERMGEGRLYERGPGTMYGRLAHQARMTRPSCTRSTRYLDFGHGNWQLARRTDAPQCGFVCMFLFLVIMSNAGSILR